MPIDPQAGQAYYYIIIRYILRLHGHFGNEHGNYYRIIGQILGLHRDDGQENGNYYLVIGYNPVWRSRYVFYSGWNFQTDPCLYLAHQEMGFSVRSLVPLNPKLYVRGSKIYCWILQP